MTLCDHVCGVVRPWKWWRFNIKWKKYKFDDFLSFPFLFCSDRRVLFHDPIDVSFNFTQYSIYLICDLFNIEFSANCLLFLFASLFLDFSFININININWQIVWEKKIDYSAIIHKEVDILFYFIKSYFSRLIGSDGFSKIARYVRVDSLEKS